MFLARKRIAWETWLDMPIGLELRQAPGTDAAMTAEIILGDPGLRYSGPFTGSEEQGWLVVLGITNLGSAPVRGRDFSASLTFAFPGRQIHAARVLPETAARTARRAARAPAIRLSGADSPESGSGASRPARMYLIGDYVLHPSDSYTVMLLLSGNPAVHSRRIQQEGSLASGRIIPTGEPATRPDRDHLAAAPPLDSAPPWRRPVRRLPDLPP